MPKANPKNFFVPLYHSAFKAFVQALGVVYHQRKTKITSIYGSLVSQAFSMALPAILKMNKQNSLVKKLDQTLGLSCKQTSYHGGLI